MFIFVDLDMCIVFNVLVFVVVVLYGFYNLIILFEYISLIILI